METHSAGIGVIEQEKKALHRKGDIALDELGELIDELLEKRDDETSRRKLQKLSLDKLEEFKLIVMKYLDAMDKDERNG